MEAEPLPSSPGSCCPAPQPASSAWVVVGGRRARLARSSHEYHRQYARPERLPVRRALRRPGGAHRGLGWFSQALESWQAIHGDGTLREIALEKRGLRRRTRGNRIAGDRGAGRGGLGLAPMQEGVDCIKRRDSAARVVLAQRERSCQHTQLPEFSRRPLDAPARRQAPIREFRDVPLQTDRQIAELPCCFAPRSAVGGRNHGRTRPSEPMAACSPGARHQQRTGLNSPYKENSTIRARRHEIATKMACQALQY